MNKPLIFPENICCNSFSMASHCPPLPFVLAPAALYFICHALCLRHLQWRNTSTPESINTLASEYALALTCGLVLFFTTHHLPCVVCRLGCRAQKATAAWLKLDPEGTVLLFALSAALLAITMHGILQIILWARKSQPLQTLFFRVIATGTGFLSIVIWFYSLNFFDAKKFLEIHRHEDEPNEMLD